MQAPKESACALDAVTREAAPIPNDLQVTAGIIAIQSDLGAQWASLDTLIEQALVEPWGCDCLFDRPFRRQWSVGKEHLVKRLEMLFQMERIKLPTNHPEAAVIARGLRVYETKSDPEGDLKDGASRSAVTTIWSTPWG